MVEILIQLNEGGCTGFIYWFHLLVGVQVSRSVVETLQ